MKSFLLCFLKTNKKSSNPWQSFLDLNVWFERRCSKKTAWFLDKQLCVHIEGNSVKSIFFPTFLYLLETAKTSINRITICYLVTSAKLRKLLGTDPTVGKHPYLENISLLFFLLLFFARFFMVREEEVNIILLYTTNNSSSAQKFLINFHADSHSLPILALTLVFSPSK